MIQFPHLAQRIFNTPIAIAPVKAEIILSALSGRLGVSELERADGSLWIPDVNMQSTIASNVGDKEEPNYHIEQNIAIIRVGGTLVHKNSFIGAMSGLTGYDELRHSFNAALSDPNVKAIAFDIDSGGGEVSGCFDLCDSIYAARGRKPMMAILSEMAYSAAYAIASSCDIVTVPRTGGTGSVGVVAMHVDYSERLASEGVKVTMIHYGSHKVDGNESMPLSKDGMKKIQEMVNQTGELFVETVARNRKMTKKAVRETQAQIYYGKSGVEVGFADGVNSPDEAFSELLKLI